jgi:ribose transport system ATP-binding protein
VPGWVLDVTLDIRPGEIVGLAGLMGAGPHSVLGVLAMIGAIGVMGQSLVKADAQSLTAAGAVFVTEVRKGQGLFLNIDAARNFTGASLVSYFRGAMSKTRQNSAPQPTSLRVLPLPVAAQPLRWTVFRGATNKRSCLADGPGPAGQPLLWTSRRAA